MKESKFENDQEFIEFRKPSKKSFNESFKENSIIKNKYEVELFNLMKKDNFNKTNLFIYSKPFIKYLKLVSNRIEDSEFILIIDDERNNCKSLKRLLNNYYFKYGLKNKMIIILNDGIEALTLLYYDTLFNMKISMVISDLNMKFMNGDLLFEVINKITRLKIIKFVLYTNTDFSTSMLKVKGLKYYLNKPCSKIDIEKLLEKINNN